MKKVFALLLTLAMLLPTVLPMAKADVTAEPFYALGWSDFDEKTYPHLDGLVTTDFSLRDGAAQITYGQATILYGNYTDADVTAFAATLKQTMDARPEGLRYWQIGGISQVFAATAENALYLDKGVAQLKAIFTDILKKMVQLCCPLDGVVIRTEFDGFCSAKLYEGNELPDNSYKTNKNLYADIVYDPRYETQIRPLLEAQDFSFWPNARGQKSEIFSICPTNKGDKFNQARSTWDNVVRIHLNAYANEWCYEPLKTAYPNASLSDYLSYDSLPWLQIYESGSEGVTAGSSVRVGTASSASYYYEQPGADFYENNKRYAAYNHTIYAASAFNSLLYDINFTRHMYDSTDSGQIAPWITSYVYGSRTGEKPHSIAKTPYYAELLYHLGLFDPEPFLSYTDIKDYRDPGKEPSLTAKDYLLTQQILNDVLAELTRVAGYSDRKPIPMPQDWNGDFILSGMYANGRNIWRITPNTDKISPEAFKVQADDPTFRVGGRTVTFPGGKLIADTKIENAGACGYWVETDQNALPLVTTDTDRFAKAPSFEENFDNYPDGPMTAPKLNNAYAWGYSVSAGESSIQNKALSVTGSVTYQNSVIPNRLTAAGSYAKEQTWAITVTVPEGLAEKAEIHLLRYDGTGTKVKDGGIKIQQDTLYYSELLDKDDPNKIRTEYKPLCKLKPGTYTVNRTMDMTDPENFYYSFSLLDQSGKEIAKAKKIPCPEFETISFISFNANKADKPVLFDDYKLYPAGTATDLALYDAATGKNVPKETSRNTNTAYRLSWLNGSKTAKTVYVMADCYEGETLVEQKVIRELTMKPGCDGVTTGIAEAAEGQQMKLYLQEAETKKSAPVLPIIAVAVGLLGIIVLCIILKRKKKSPAPVVEETPEV